MVKAIQFTTEDGVVDGKLIYFGSITVSSMAKAIQFTTVNGVVDGKSNSVYD